MKNEFAGVATTFLTLLVYGNFSIHSRAANSAALGPICPKFKLCPDIMVILVTLKTEEDPINNAGAKVATSFSPL